MKREMLKSKIHRAAVTQTRLEYEGSITVDRALCRKADLREFEKVDVYNCSTGARFTTYVICGRKGGICINGAAARLAAVGDKVIIASYAAYAEAELAGHVPIVVKC
ncbi:MAG: aspartate 1-decarboxylase [Elusimicrobia bacterium]|nr:aspartate 1-decarboxylase [Elusimicrobiota bacterium]